MNKTTIKQSVLSGLAAIVLSTVVSGCSPRPAHPGYRLTLYSPDGKILMDKEVPGWKYTGRDGIEFVDENGNDALFQGTYLVKKIK